MLLLGSTAWSDDLYNNLGPGGTFDTTSGGSVFNLVFAPPSPDEVCDVAMPFTVAPGQDFKFENVSLGLGGPGGITLSLDLDNGGVPGSVLTSMHGTVNDTALYTFSDPNETTLFGGQTYWITASADSDSFILWFSSVTQGGNNGLISNDAGSSWDNHVGDLSLEVQGVAVVPEPTSCAIIGLGVIGMFYFVPRRKN